MLTVGSVFAGIGGFDLGFERAGAKVIWNCEIDAKCRKVLQKHWPGVPRFKDVRTVTGAGLRAAGLVPDILVGGFPCQDLSVAGARAGLDGERSGLFFEFARIAEEAKPEWLVIENVPGLLSAGCKPPCPGGCVATHGGAMGAVIGTLGDIGYVGAWRVLDAQYFGVAQRRRRVFLVGHIGDGRRAAEVLLEPEGGGGDPPARRAPGEGPARGAEAGAGTDGEPYTFDWQAGGHGDTSFRGKSRIYPVRKPGLSGSLQENKVEAVAIPGPIAGSGEIVQGLTGSFGNGGADDNKAQAGWLVPAVSHSLCAPSTGGAHNDHNGETLLPVAFHMTQDPITGDISPAIGGVKPTTGYSTVGCAYPVAQRGRGGESEMELGEPDLHNALRAGDGGSSRHQQILTPQLAVRRLLPVECLRLMAFPDDWLDGLRLADSVKYRQVGNAVCTSVVYWIARRLIAAHEGRDLSKEIIDIGRYIADLNGTETAG